MNIAIVDDEQSHIDKLVEIIHDNYDFLELIEYRIHTFKSSKEFMESFAVDKYQLIFLDILIDDMTGIDIAREIRKQDEYVPIVFCSVTTDFSSESYEVNSVYYAKKPFDDETISKLIKFVNMKRIWLKQTITLPDNYRFFLYNLIYTDYNNHAITLHVDGEDYNHIFHGSQKDIASILLKHKYMHEINQSLIVNLLYVKSISGSMCMLNTGEMLPISRSKLKGTKLAYADFVMENM